MQYLDAVLEQVPRLLTQMDRQWDSPTCGCFDRNYWHYKTTDFPCARHQEAAYTLALLYNTDHPNNPYYRNEHIKQWAISALQFWAKNQAPDGSFSEWYPYEHSFVATTFSTLAALETMKEFNKEKYIQPRGVDVAVYRACRWIDRHDEPLVSNQMAGSILALALASKSGIHKFNYMERLQRLLNRQTKEGWFKEYAGFDAGYSYVTLDYLARLSLLDKQLYNALEEPLNRLLEFLQYFIHPDGTTGYYYTSRNTSYIIPSGLEILADNPIARAIANKEIMNIIDHGVIWDDRYLCYQLYYHLLAFRYENHTQEPVKLPYQKKCSKMFHEAKLYVSSSNGHYGVRNLEDNRSLNYKDGVYLEATEQKYFPSMLMTPPKTILARLYQMTLGRYDYFAQLLKTMMRKRLIMDKTGSSSIYVPSSRYFHENEFKEP